MLIEDAGGDEKLTFAGKEAIKIAAAMIVESEAFQTDIVNNTPIDHARFIRLTNAITRILRIIGARKNAKDLPLTVRQQLIERKPVASKPGHRKGRR